MKVVHLNKKNLEREAVLSQSGKKPHGSPDKA